MRKEAASPDGWTYRQRWVRCHETCATCDGGGKHGPYWYRQRKVHGRVVTEYLGKNLPEKVNRDERN